MSEGRDTRAGPRADGRGLLGSVVFAAALVLVGVLYAPTLATFMAAMGAAYYLCGSLIAVLPARRHDLRRRLIAAAIYVLATVIGIGAGRYYFGQSRQHRDAVVSAIALFQTRHDRPPRDLNELVPGELPEVPLAVPTPVQPLAFDYRRDGAAWSVCYAALPMAPLCYDPGTGEWEVRD